MHEWHRENEVQSSRIKNLGFLTHEDGSDRLSLNVGNYNYTPRNSPEERNSHHESLFS
jgi:hypothetical protein